MVNGWNASEKEFVRANAGTMSVSEMAHVLCKSEASITSMAKRMRKSGEFPLLRKCELPVCPTCLTPRTVVFPNGTCRVCRSRATLDENIRRYHATVEAMNPDVKKRYLTELSLQKDAEPIPSILRSNVSPHKAYAVLEEEQLAEISRVRSRLRKRIKTAKDFV